MPESPSLIPAEVKQMLLAGFANSALENESVAATLESRGQAALHSRIAHEYAERMVASMEKLGDEHGLAYHISEVAIETHLPPVPRFWTAWKRLTDSLRLRSPIEGSYWLPNGWSELPPLPHESVARDLANREPLPPPPPPPVPSLPVTDVENLLRAAVEVAVREAVGKPEATESEVETTNSQGVKSTSKVRTKRRAL